MPKKRKHKRNAKGRQKRHTNEEVSTKAHDESHYMGNNNSTVITPAKTPSTHKMIINNLDLETTPVNRKRCINNRKSEYSSWNISNLNILFDSNYETPKSTYDVYLNKTLLSCQKSSNSSVPVMDTSLRRTPVQSYGICNENSVKNCNEVDETPRTGKFTIHQNAIVEKSLPMLNKIKNDCVQRSRIYGNEVNINPYLKHREIQHKESSFGEISFFSPNLFQHKSSSTPIGNLRNNYEIENVLDYSLAKGSTSAHVNSPQTPKIDANLNLNNIVPVDKVGRSFDWLEIINFKTKQYDHFNKSFQVCNKDESIRSLRLHTLNISKRKSFRLSPKSVRNGHNLSKVCNESQNYSYSRFNFSQRTSIEVSLENFSHMSSWERLFLKLQRYYRATRGWSTRILYRCNQLGLQLKNVCDII